MQPEILRLQKRLANLPVQRAGFAVCLVGEAGVGKSYALAQMAQVLPIAYLSTQATQNIKTLIEQLPRPKRLPYWLCQNLEKKNDSLAVLLGLLEAIAPFVLFVEDLTSEHTHVWLELAERVRGCPKVALVFSSRQRLRTLDCIVLEPLNQQRT
ncbi:MAG: hypothetical protein ACK41E_04210, partial [Deinococcales bacterium]